MKHILLPIALSVLCSLAVAKLLPPDDAAKAKAAEAAAKAAWQAKVDAYQLCKAQDRVAAIYRSSAGKATPKAATLAPAAAASGAPPQPAASGTPVAATPPPCTDPGPFAYNPPQQKPVETSQAHSPAGNATSPSSVRANSAEMAPKK